MSQSRLLLRSVVETAECCVCFAHGSNVAVIRERNRWKAKKNDANKTNNGMRHSAVACKKPRKGTSNNGTRRAEHRSPITPGINKTPASWDLVDDEHNAQREIARRRISMVHCVLATATRGANQQTLIINSITLK